MKIKHKQFVDHYLANGCNATRSYMAVYPHVKEESAAVLSSNLLRNVKVAHAIEVAQKQSSANSEITKEELLNDLRDIKNAQKNEDSKASIKAIEVLNKMLGFNAPIETKQDITVKGDMPLFGPLDNGPTQLND